MTQGKDVKYVIIDCGPSPPNMTSRIQLLDAVLPNYHSLYMRTYINGNEYHHFVTHFGKKSYAMAMDLIKANMWDA